mmetsp:Transcript_544/g.1208  ORF Transcript_544/g.1208 Transcript_544/m.1208 type:complete len:347 (+) Transcript_544:148-1188(+)
MEGANVVCPPPLPFASSWKIDSAGQRPAPMPAARAAPRAVVSMSSGRTTGIPRMSACMFMRSAFCVAPPSTRRAPTLSPSASAFIASSTSRLWKQIASSVARAMCAFVQYCVIPTMHPRASVRQCGAKSPLKAGTKHTPAESGTLAASPSISFADLMIPRLSLSHDTAAPAMATLPSSAYWGGASLPSWNAIVERSPWLDGTSWDPVLRSMKHPVPYVFFASPGLHRWPSVAACWSPRHPAMGTPASAPARTVPYTSALLTMRGSRLGGMRRLCTVGSCQARVFRSMRSVREAFVTSITCAPPWAPPVSMYMSHVSTVPNRARPSSAADFTWGTLSRSQRSFTPLK